MATQVDPLIYPARPRFKVDGQDRPELTDGLMEMSVEETVEGLRHCELTFSNWGPKNGSTGFLHFDRQMFDFGKSVTIEAGGGVGEGQLFDGRITALEGRYQRARAPELLVLAEDRLQDLRMTRRTRTFENISDTDLVKQVASQHGLQAQVNGSGPTHKVLAQVNQSDLAFLRERARAVDAELWIEGTTLKMDARNARASSSFTLTIGLGLFECSIAADLAGQVSGFAVTGWDTSAKQGITHRATDSTISGELDGKQSGSTVLGQALGTRNQQIVHLTPVTTQEAQAHAEAQYRRAARRFVSGVGLAEGDARIRVGAKVELRGVGPLFEGKYHVTRSRHQFDGRQGFRTHFAVERPGIGGP
jgi:hypothetical protein